jgi:hypothetical protein
MTDQWPIFPLRMKCPGGLDHWSKKEFFCHESHDRTFVARHGELYFEVTVCGHVWDSNGCSSFKEEISDFLKCHYDSVTNYSANTSKLVAFTRGFSWSYVWDYSTFAKCGQCEWQSQSLSESDSMRRFYTFVAKTSGANFPWIYRHAKESSKVFCSAKCASAFVNADCPVCGVGNEATISDNFRTYRERLCNRFNIWITSANHCSRHCCSLAVHDYLRNEREERKRKKNLKCVLEVKKVLSKAKSALRNRDNQEALQSLKKAFEQAASSH